MLRTAGAAKLGVNTWYLLSDDELATGGLIDPGLQGETAFQNLYRVLWYYERVESALHFDLIDPEVLYRTIGFHCWWWGQLLRDVHGPKASDALHRLAPKATDWAREHGLYEQWVARCLTDFAGAGPIEPAPFPPSPAVAHPMPVARAQPIDPIESKAEIHEQ
jgi:hypothetical protein